MNKRVIFISILLILFISSFGLLLGFRYAGIASVRVLTVGEISSMPFVDGDYRSINNWATIENTTFKGVRVIDILNEAGAKDDAEIKIISPDGYFWPAVGDTLTPADFNEENPQGLYPVIAFEMDGKTLDPEPKGTGPLRLVMPQYNEEDVNKPSWVSNIRLIEVGPVPEDGEKAPDAGKVPADEVWLYGSVGAVYPYGLWLPLLFAGLALIAGGFLMFEIAKKHKWFGKGQVAFVVCLCLAACLTFLPSSVSTAHEYSGAGGFTFSVSDLRAMPACSGHYSFLKSQPPYTYYEEDYTGVALSYLLEEKLQLVSGASSVAIKATDGYSKSLSLSQIRTTYPGGLKIILAYAKGGSSLVGDEGPLRLIVPQAVQGNKDQGGDMNTPMCIRMVNAIEVSPMPAGESPANAPSGGLAVYGSVTARQAPEPAPPAPATDTQQPAAQPQEQAQSTVPGVDPGAVTAEGADKIKTIKNIQICSFTMAFALTGIGYAYLPMLLLIF
ncbi:MAG: molybdopterin-dependent oxidoreductase [Actinobacteria bacterium]|nr:molybdopterin-dependent oxidoreductase [Actinomycetota bacterium]